jgi:hypothetical protein
MSKPIYIQHYSQFFDGNGEPLAGGLLYTYEAGTTTPKDTFTDPAGTVSNPNPIVLDSEGKPENGAIYLDGTYKFVLHDSDDVPVSGAETDNVESYATQTQINEILEDVQEEIDTIQEQVVVSLVGQGTVADITAGSLLFTKIKDMVFIQPLSIIEYTGAPFAGGITGIQTSAIIPASFRAALGVSVSYFISPVDGRIDTTIFQTNGALLLQIDEEAPSGFFTFTSNFYAVAQP